MVIVPDTCYGCGACCYAMGVHVDPWDTVPEEMTEIVLLGPSKRPVRMLKRRETHECVALDQNLLCTIHCSKPTICAGFERGSEECIRAIEVAERGAADIPPFAARQQKFNTTEY